MTNFADGTNLQYLAILQAAVTSAFGLRLRVSNPVRARQALYRFRKEFGDPSFEDLMLKVSPDDPEGELWLLNKPTITLDAGNI